ncbi:hypothetical protein ACMHYO_01860 [Allopusillimonas ginsengisoli]|uniref:hypothetical protein n=1 Tax=Allopusillimonas ginsengisoli TaxID=453575 RepID=UPI0039C3E128
MTFNNNRLLKTIILICIPVILALNVNLNQMLTDSFHEGEYLGNVWAMRNYYRDAGNFPVLVHGAMDFIPSLISLEIWGDGRAIIYTRLVNVLATLAGWILYILSAKKLLGEGKIFAFALFMFSFIWMAASSGTKPLGLQQAFIGTRDAFLVTSIFLAITGMSATSEIRRLLFLCAAGFAAAISLYWSYDRGIMAAAFVCVLGLIFLSTRRRIEAAAVSFGYLICLLAVSLSGLLGTARENVSNIMYWIKYSSEVWYMSDALKMPVVYWGGGIALFAVFAIAYALIKIYSYRLNDMTPILGGLIAVQILFIFKLFSLPTPNSFYFVWPAILLFLATQASSYSPFSGFNASLNSAPDPSVDNSPRLSEEIFRLIIVLAVVSGAVYFCLSRLPTVSSVYFFSPIVVIFSALVMNAFLKNSKTQGGSANGYLIRFLDDRRDSIQSCSLLLTVLSVAYLSLWNSSLIYDFSYTWPTIIITATILSNSAFKHRPRALQDSVGKQSRPLFSNIITANIAYYFSLILVIFAASYFLSEHVKWRNITNSAQQILAPDFDIQIVDLNHYGLMDMNDVNFDCIWQWSNEGIFSYFSKKPFCTKYPYAVYISKDNEYEVLNEVVNAPPKFIVFHSNNWYVSIYGRSMESRLPLLHEFIVRNYRFDENSDGYTFATLK